jgi:hypothetical protein
MRGRNPLSYVPERGLSSPHSGTSLVGFFNREKDKVNVFRRCWFNSW